MQTFENYLPQFLNRDLSAFILPGVVLLIIAFVLCRFLVFTLSKVFEAICDWSEYKLVGRKTRRASLISRKKKSQSVQLKTNNAELETTPKKTTSLSSSRKGRIIDAQNVLRRNAEAYTNRHKN